MDEDYEMRRRKKTCNNILNRKLQDKVLIDNLESTQNIFTYILRYRTFRIILIVYVTAELGKGKRCMSF